MERDHPHRAVAGGLGPRTAGRGHGHRCIRILFPGLGQAGQMGACSGCHPRAPPRFRLVRRGEPGVRRLADQMGRGERDHGLHSRLVLERRPGTSGSLAQGLPQGSLPRPSQVLYPLVRPQGDGRTVACRHAPSRPVLARRAFPHGFLLSIGFSFDDGPEFREYRVDLASHPRWRGRIIQFRFDPCCEANPSVEIDEIRLEKRSAQPRPD